MNTKQLVAFWYMGIAIIVVLIGFAEENPDFRLWFYLTSIIVLGSLFIYFFASHPEANKKIVAASVGIPVLITISTLLIINLDSSSSSSDNKSQSTSTNLSKAISKDEIEIFDAQLSHSTGLLKITTLTGRIRNLSDESLSSFTLRVNIYKDGELVDGTDAFIDEFRYDPVPPKGVQSFEKRIYDLRPPEDWSWNYTIKEIYPKYNY